MSVLPVSGRSVLPVSDGRDEGHERIRREALQVKYDTVQHKVGDDEGRDGFACEREVYKEVAEGYLQENGGYTRVKL